MASQLDNFVGDITDSTYWSGLAQYGGVGPGSFTGEFDIDGAPPQNVVGLGGLKVTTNANVEAELSANLGQTNTLGQTLPNPNANTLYVVYMPPGDPFNFTDGTGVKTVAASYSIPGGSVPWTVLGISTPGTSPTATPTRSCRSRARSAEGT